jgi:hypothetical protein
MPRYMSISNVWKKPVLVCRSTTKKLTDKEIAESFADCEELFDELLDDPRFNEIVAYALWADLSRYLAQVGWTPQELAEDVSAIAAHQTAA